jgi:ClpP class serine protease
VAQGRVWTGHQALERGLVDEIGGLDRAIQIAKEKAKLPANQVVDLMVYPLKKSFWELLGDPLGSEPATGLDLFAAQVGRPRHRRRGFHAPPVPARRAAHDHAECVYSIAAQVPGFRGSVLGQFAAR